MIFLNEVISKIITTINEAYVKHEDTCQKVSKRTEMKRNIIHPKYLMT
jgi:hypothetical protein